MRKFFVVISVIFILIVIVACNNNAGTTTPKTSPTNPYCDELTAEPNVREIKVGMVTDSGTIDDKSFNQGTWQGIQCYNTKHRSQIKYLQPGGEAKEDYLSSIDNLVDTGYEMIIAPGYKFEEAIHSAQTTHSNIKFVILDGYPHPGDFEADIKSNTISIIFAEEQAGFFAGIAAALQSETGKVGFIGGMEIPAVKKFGYGFVAGVAYANDRYDKNVVVTNYVYEGTFTNTGGGQSLASGMYDGGVDIIFAAAGGVGTGVINEARTRAEGNEKVWVIGVDVDQYDAGIYGNRNKSVILTSAMKRIDIAAYTQAQLFGRGAFVGGKQVTYDITNNGVGIPANNPNLTQDTINKISEVKTNLKNGTIQVPKDIDELRTYLTELGYTTPQTVTY